MNNNINNNNNNFNSRSCMDGMRRLIKLREGLVIKIIIIR